MGRQGERQNRDGVTREAAVHAPVVAQACTSDAWDTLSHTFPSLFPSVEDPLSRQNLRGFSVGLGFFFWGGGDVLSVAAIYLNQKFRRKEVCIKITFSSSKFCEYEMRNIPKYSDNTRLARATGLPWSTLET